MPKVTLPHNFKGWFVTVLSSIVGFIAGTVALAWLSERFR